MVKDRSLVQRSQVQQPLLLGDASNLTGITLTDSNDEWIDQDNRLGQNFYMGQVNIKRLGNPFYYEPEHRIMNDNEVVVRYGRRGPIPELGVYEITESLRAGVLGFRRIGDKFEPVYDLVPRRFKV